MIAGDQFGIGGYNSTNRVAAVYPKKDPLDRMIEALDRKNKELGPGFPTVDEDDPYKFSQGHRTSDASKNKVYSDMNPSSLGASDGSLIAMANTENRGIRTPAPETKVTETKRMAGGFFSPKNFQRSGVPDATIMTREQMGQAITGDPGYTRFGSLDRPGTQAAKDTAAFNEAYKRSFFAPRETDARSIAERREASTQTMKDEAKVRDTQFKETGKQTFGGKVGGERISGDDTYGTKVMSNPAFGFRSKMSDENKARYDSSATEASRRAEVEPNKGNLLQSTMNVGKRIFNTAIGASEGTPLTQEVKLETRGEAEQRRYEKYLNRPTYQREATARVEAGITPQMIKDKNQAEMRADAAARNKEFQSNKRAKAVEKASKRVKENTGTGRDGSFGAGTTGKGMPSNPDFRGAGNNKKFAKKKAEGFKKKSPTKKKSSVSKSNTGSKKASRGASGSSTSRSKGGTKSSGSKSNTGSKKASRGASGGTSSRSRGGTGTGGTSTSRKASTASRRRTGRSKTRCDIRCKFDIKPLTEMNLIMDDLAEVAYFVKEIQK